MPLAAAAATFNFSGAIGGANFPACSGGTWSASGNTYTCSGSIALAAGDAILPSSPITVVAQAGAALTGNNTLGSATTAVTLQTVWSATIAISGGNNAIYGNLTTDSGAVNISGSNNSIFGNLTATNWGPITAANTTVSGKIDVYATVTLTNTTVIDGVSTHDKAIMTGGSVGKDVVATNGVTTNGTVIGGNVQLSNSGEVSLTGGSVGGAVHSDCCNVSTKNTNVGNGVSSNSSTVTIDGGTISGPVSTNGGSGIIVKNGASVTGTLTSSQPVTVDNGTIYGSITSGNKVTLSNNTMVWGGVTAASGWGGTSLVIDGTSLVSGHCDPSNPRCMEGKLHVRLSHAGSGVTCTGSPVTVTACSDFDIGDYCVPFTGGISGSLVVKNAIPAVPDIPFTIPSGSSSVVLSVAVGTPQTVLFDSTLPTTCWNTAGSGTASCSHEYSNAGFIVSSASNSDIAVSIATQAAGVDSAKYYLRAVKLNPITKACEAAIKSSSAIDLSYECVDPTTCYSANLMKINALDASEAVTSSTTIARNNKGSSSSTAQVVLNFDDNGSAPFTLNYADAGGIKLHATKSLGTTLTGAWYFVTKPYAFKLAATCSQGDTANAIDQTNPVAADPHKFCPAGSTFTARVTAVAKKSSADPGAPDPVAYNYGLEAAPEIVAVTWSRHLPLGTGTSDGTMPTGTFSYGGGYGSFAGTGFTWDEVGILKATISIGDGDYLGAGNMSSTGYVGRFYPHHFHTVPSGQPGCTAFAYSGHGSGLSVVPGQPFNVAVVAKNANGDAETNTTKNYSFASGFAKDVTLSLPPGSTAGKLYRDTTVGVGTVTADAFTQGVGTVAFDDDANRISFVFDTYLTLPTDIPIHAEDADTGTTTGTDGTLSIRTGRLRLSNAFGSEKRTLDMPVQAQYWSGHSWVLNNDDGCTSLPKTAFSLVLPSPGFTALTASPLPGVPGIDPLTNKLLLSGGRGRVTFSAPGRVGSVDMAVHLGASGVDQSCLATHGGTAANLSWLRAANGSCPAAAANNSDPSARATFGIYTPETRRMIHVREMF